MSVTPPSNIHPLRLPQFERPKEGLCLLSGSCIDYAPTIRAGFDVKNLAQEKPVAGSLALVQHAFRCVHGIEVVEIVEKRGFVFAAIFRRMPVIDHLPNHLVSAKPVPATSPGNVEILLSFGCHKAKDTRF